MPLQSLILLLHCHGIANCSTLYPFLRPDDLLVNLVESRSVIEALLDSLPNNFANTPVVDSAFGPALQVRNQRRDR